MIKQQEVEIKIQLHTRRDYEKFAAHMQQPLSVVHQHNYFFDGTNRELLNARAAMRLRFLVTKDDEYCVLTHKGRVVLHNGVSSAQECEEPVADIQLAHKAIEDPNSMMQWDGELIEMIRSKYGISGFICLGGFKTLRKEYPLQVTPEELSPVIVELDETVYTFGTKYEIEIETKEPEVIKPQLCSLLDQLDISYKDSKTTKFEDLLRESLL